MSNTTSLAHEVFKRDKSHSNFEEAHARTSAAARGLDARDEPPPPDDEGGGRPAQPGRKSAQATHGAV